jgi:steroid 5-alpha reductase family enzyme
MAIAGSQGGAALGPLPAFAACALLAYAVQWVAFIPAYVFQTEAFYDLTGSITYLSVVALAVTVSGDDRALLLAALIAIWALRLGSFLFLRIRKDGGDSRFTSIKPQFFRFLMFWTIQGLWVVMTAAAALAAMTSGSVEPLGPIAAVGVALWLAGFAFEVVADHQKRVFRRDPANRGKFIRSGLWAWSRHPNYAGEIVLWCGIALIALPALSGWQYAALISPVFVYILLTRVSGIPPLEGQARHRWGDDPAYIAYRDSTPILWPRPPRQPPA